MKETKSIDVFNQDKRKIKCIANKHDYLGNGDLVREDELEIGKVYTMVAGRVEAYGSMVSLEEVPSKYGFQSYLFEELKAYDEDIINRKYQHWLMEKLNEAEKDMEDGRYISAEEAMKKLRERTENNDGSIHGWNK